MRIRVELHRVRVSGAVQCRMGRQANSLIVRDAKTLKTTATLAMGKVPVTLGFSPDGQFAYVSHFEDNFVSVGDAHAF